MVIYFKFKGDVWCSFLLLLPFIIAAAPNENVTKIMSNTLDSSIFSISPTSISKFYRDSCSVNWLKYGAICSTKTEDYSLYISFNKDSLYQLENIIVQTVPVDSTTTREVRDIAYSSFLDSPSGGEHPDGEFYSWALSLDRYVFLFIEKLGINKYKLRVTVTTQLAQPDY